MGATMVMAVRRRRGGATPHFVLWSPAAIASFLLLLAQNNSNAGVVVAAFSPPQPAAISSNQHRRALPIITGRNGRGLPALAAVSGSGSDSGIGTECNDDQPAGDTSTGSNIGLDKGLGWQLSSSSISSSLRTALVASALFASIVLGDMSGGGNNNNNNPGSGPISGGQAAWAADAPAKPAAAKPAAPKPAAAATTSSTTNSAPKSPIEASLHIPKLRTQIRTLRQTLLDRESVARQDRRAVTRNMEKVQRLKAELKRSTDDERRARIKLERNELRKKAALADQATSTTISTNAASGRSNALLSKAQIQNLNRRVSASQKRISTAKTKLTAAETNLKTTQTALDKSSRDAAKIQKDLADARKRMRDAKKLGRGTNGRYAFNAVAPAVLGGGLVWWLANNREYMYGRDGYDNYGGGEYGNDYSEYEYGGSSRLDRNRNRNPYRRDRLSQRRQLQTLLALLCAAGITSSITTFDAEGDGITGSTVFPLALGVGVLSWAVVWQQRRGRYGDRYDEYGNRIVGGGGGDLDDDLWSDPTATQAAIILFSALGLTAALLSYGSYGDGASDLLGGSTFLVLGAVGVGIWSYNRNDEYGDFFDGGEGGVYGSGQRFVRGLPFDFDAVFGRRQPRRRYGDDFGQFRGEGGVGTNNWWEWWRRDPERYSNGLSRRDDPRSSYYDGADGGRRVDVIGNDDYYANYDLDRRLSGPPRPPREPTANGYYDRDRAGPLARRGEYARPPRGDGYFADGRGQYREEQDRRFREYSDRPPPGGGGSRGAPPPGAGSRSVAGGEGSQNRDSNRWGNSLSQWD